MGRLRHLCSALPVLVLATAITARAQSADSAASQPARAMTPLADIRPAAVPADRPEAIALNDDPELASLVAGARARLEDRNLSAAIEKLGAALARLGERRCYEAELLTAEIRAQTGALNDATEAARRACAIHPDSADANCILGGLLATQGKVQEAIAHFRAATLATRDAASVRVTVSWMRLAVALAAEGYALAAAEAFEQFDRAIWDVSPEHRNAPEVRAWLDQFPRGAFDERLELYHELKRSLGALRTTLQAVERWPDDVYVARRHGLELIAANHAPDALKLAAEWFFKPGGVGAMAELAIAAAKADIGLGAWVDSIVADIRGGRSLELGEALVPRLNDAGEFDAAETLVAALVAAGRGAASGLNWELAIAHWMRGRTADAVDALAETIRRNAGDLALTPAERFARFARRKPALAADAATQQRQRGESDAATYTALALGALGAEQLALCESLVRTALERQADFAPALVVRALAQIANFEWDAARKTLAPLTGPRAECAAAMTCLGRAHDGLDANSDAQQAFKRAIRLSPRDATPMLDLARHYLRLVDMTAAQRYFGEALTVDPALAAAHEGLIESYVLDNKSAIAADQLRRMEQAGVPERALRRATLRVRYREAMLSNAFVDELRKLIDDDPSDAIAGVWLAGALLLRDELDESAAVLDRVTKAAPGDYASLVALAQVRAQRVEFPLAIAALEELIKRYPNRESVLTLLARYYAAEFRLADAETIYTRLARSAADSEIAKRYRAQIAALRLSFVDQVDKALELIDAELAQAPGDDFWLDLKFNALRDAGRGEQAFAIAKEALGDRAGNPEMRARFVRLAHSCADYKSAERKLREWLADDKGNLELTEWLINTLILDDRAEEAFKVAADFAAPDWKTSLLVRHWMSRCHAGKRDYARAIAELEALLSERLDPDDQRDAREELIDNLGRAGELDKALARVDEWASAFPPRESQLRALNKRRELLQNTEREDEYARVMEKMYDLLPENVGLNNDLGYTWVDQNKHVPRALVMIRRAVAAEPLNAAYLDSLGWAYYKLGQFAEAQRFLARCIRLREGQDPVLFDHCADAAQRLGDARTAMDHWKKAAELIEKELRDAKTPRPDRERLLTRVRAKIAAAERGEAPPVAPTAETARPGDKP